MEIPQELKELSKRDLIRIILDLQRRIAIYENAHTPPSQKKFPERKKSSSGKIGAPEGHEGATRKSKEPDEVKELEEVQCKHCHGLLDKPYKQKRKIVEEIPEPQPIKVIEYRINHYLCPFCNKVTIANHPDLPQQGIFGKNILAHVTLLKFADRLPLRKVMEALNRQFNLDMTSATVFDITRRVTEQLTEKYKALIQRIRDSSYVFIDETGIKVQGKQYWIWTFTTNIATLYVIRKSRSKKVLKEILGSKYKGIIICDGLSAYDKYTDKIQRCWAHLLRESEDLAGKFYSAKLVHKELVGLYSIVKNVKYEDPPSEREKLFGKCVEKMKRLTKRMNYYKELRKFAVTIFNGAEYFFTRILHPEIEPTNNRAERALRELVVQRKIIGTLRNNKGVSIMETITSMLATWKQNGLNQFNELRTSLS